MNNNYLKNKYGEVIGVENETTIFEKRIKDVHILVTQQPTDSNNEDYFNV